MRGGLETGIQLADRSGRRDASIEPSEVIGNKLRHPRRSKLLHGEYNQWYHRRVNWKSKKMRMTAGLAILAVPIALGVVFAGQSQSQPQTQTPAVSARIYEYDVVSIKLNKSDDSKHFMFSFPGDGISAENIPLRLIVQYAFGFNDSARFSQMPSWVDSERYDIEAKVEPSLRETLAKLSQRGTQSHPATDDPGAFEGSDEICIPSRDQGTSGIYADRRKGWPQISDIKTDCS